MIPLDISIGNDTGFTILSNAFIDQYMKDANDAQIKIYLYLLRMVGAKLPTDISEIADIFNHTEKDVIRCLKYWEEKGLLNLSYDNTGNISGIILRDLSSQQDKNMVQSNTNTATDNYSSEAPATIHRDYRKERAEYGPKDMAPFANNEEVKMLISVAATYLGRPLNPDETISLIFMYDKLNFSFDMIDYVIDYSVANSNKNFASIEKLAISLCQDGIDTVEKAKAATKPIDKEAYAIMQLLGKSGKPTSLELDYIRKWTRTYSFAMQVIVEACNRTVLATDRNRFQYADSILKSWHEKSVTSKQDIEACDKEYENTKSAHSTKSTGNTKANTTKSHTTNAHKSNMMRHNYDIAAIERALTQ